MTSRNGVPLAVIVSAANQHDVRWLLPLVFQHFPVLGGRRGRPRRVPRMVRADSGYTSKHLMTMLNWCGIAAEIPQRGSLPAQGLGKHRWPVERALAWLEQYRRVGIRRDRRADIYNAFVTLASALIAFRKSLPD